MIIQQTEQKGSDIYFYHLIKRWWLMNYIIVPKIDLFSFSLKGISDPIQQDFSDGFYFYSMSIICVILQFWILQQLNLLHYIIIKSSCSISSPSINLTLANNNLGRYINILQNYNQKIKKRPINYISKYSGINSSISNRVTFQLSQNIFNLINYHQFQHKRNSYNICSIEQYYSNSMLRLVFLFFLLSIASSQACCHDPGLCPSNSSCLCEGSANSCIYEIVEQNITFSMKNQANYYNWVPSTSDYMSVTVSFCKSSSNKVLEFKAGFKIQNDNAQGYPQDPNVAFQINNNCYHYIMYNPEFCTTPSGGFCNLIVSIVPNSTNNQSEDQIQIYVSYAEGLTKYIIFILIGVGVVLLLIVIILVGCMIKRKMMEPINVQAKDKSISIQHFDKMLPITTLKDTIVDLQNIEQSKGYQCSVCLSQIQQSQKVRRILCGHIFHVQCIDFWCIRNLSCPMCREPLDQQSLILKGKEISQGLSNEGTCGGQQTVCNLIKSN